jgi:tetratricopeptide (TPR) repeat protein
VNYAAESLAGTWDITLERKVGDTILGWLRVLDIKRGGFGVVYICGDKEGAMWAVKSFRDEFFTDDKVVNSFYHECYVWIKISGHTNVVSVFTIEQLDYKPHIVMEYVDGCSLRDLINDSRLTIPISVDLSVQFCFGMEYANSVEVEKEKRGIVHKDITPENILLTKNGTVKIADFGLVRVLEVSGASSLKSQSKESVYKKSTILGKPPYMSPEQFETTELDERSDVYSFGVVMYEMLSGEVPFYSSDWNWEDFHYHHKCTTPKPLSEVHPDIPKQLNSIILKCIKKNRAARFANFAELRRALMEVYKEKYSKDKTEVGKRRNALTRLELHTMSLSMLNLRKPKEALRYVEQLIRLHPDNAEALALKGSVLSEMDRLTEALEYLDKALKIDPNDKQTINSRGTTLAKLGKLGEALECFEKALTFDQRYVRAWNNKANTMYLLGRFAEAAKSYDKIIKMNRRDAAAWNGKGNALNGLGKFIDAIECFEEALEINPRDFIAWNNKGKAFIDLGKYKEAIKCLDRSLKINDNYALALCNKGGALGYLNEFAEAIKYFNKTLKIDSQDIDAWYYKGVSLVNLGQTREALKCIKKALKINPGFEHARELEKLLLSRIKSAS